MVEEGKRQMYLNRAEREMFLMLQAAKTAVQIAADVPKFKVEGGKVLAQTAIDTIDAWCELIIKDFPDEVKHSLYLTARESRMRIVGRQSSEAKEFHVLCPVEPLKRLVSGVVMDCAGCIKEGKEINKCSRRRDLIACGIMPERETKEICGFESGIVEE